MKRIVALASLLAIGSTAAIAGPALQICHGEYALCAASSTDATGKSIVVNGITFREGVSVCPVLHGPVGSVVGTAAAVGASNPVGGNIP